MTFLRGLFVAALSALLAFPVIVLVDTLPYREDLSAIQSKVVKIGVIQMGDMYVLGSEGGRLTVKKKRVWQRVGGSGAIISAKGDILTCAHLFESTEIKKIYVKTETGQTYLGRLVRIDKDLDLAVLRVDAVRKLPYFVLGNTPKIGDEVIAAGSPLGMQHTLSFGRVTNVNPNPTRRMLMHGASIAPGNSGGPLIDAYGKLIGVNVLMYMMSPFAPAPGTNVAVHISTIREFVRN
jgi:S1-C subfamily serine protease